MTKFEYKRMEVICKVDGIDDVLTVSGKEGWEIIWYEERPQPEKNVCIKFIMKRPIKKIKDFLS